MFKVKPEKIKYIDVFKTSAGYTDKLDKEYN